MKHVDGIAVSCLLLLPSAFASASADVFHDITKAAARLCVLVCNPFARSAGIFRVTQLRGSGLRVQELQ